MATYVWSLRSYRMPERKVWSELIWQCDLRTQAFHGSAFTVMFLQEL
jgi:hypothetical protein